MPEPLIYYKRYMIGETHPAEQTFSYERWPDVGTIVANYAREGSFDSPKWIPYVRACRNVYGRPIDAYVVIPPPSPNEENVPLSVAALAEYAWMDPEALRGNLVRPIDWNMNFMRHHAEQYNAAHPENQRTPALGDHGKNRHRVNAAVQEFLGMAGLHGEPTLFCPDTADPVAGMHYDMDTVKRATAEAVRSTVWREMLDRQVFAHIEECPPVLGVSIMGPQQVLGSLVLCSMVRERWPKTAIVLGGSHITILKDEIARDPDLYARDIDGKLLFDVIQPGHAERTFSHMINQVKRLGESATAAALWQLPHIGVEDFPSPAYMPNFHDAHLSLYDPSTVTLPVQFSQGCHFKCAMCTYPVVEPVATPIRSFDSRLACDTFMTLEQRHGIHRFSIKDSLFWPVWMRQLAEELLTRGPHNIQWSATTRASNELMRTAPIAAASGCSTVELGIETIHDFGKKLLHKNQPPPAALREIILGCAREGITVVVNLIFGLPGETLEDAQRQLAWFEGTVRLGEEEEATGKIIGSFNLLEIGLKQPLEQTHAHLLRGRAPWASTYAWAQPTWCKDFRQVLQAKQLGMQAFTCASTKS